jgi:zinc D-Ala-D-Ala dipeptidase
MNILKQRYFLLTIQTILFTFYGMAQKTDLQISKYGVPVLGKYQYYQQSYKLDSTKKLLELKEVIPGIQYDLRYATTNNFMKRRMYPAKTNITFMRSVPAQALQRVQQELAQKGLGLKIFDGYRPYSVTVKFWELVKDERYVADPKKGSGHNRGLAVDLTIIDLKSGKDLDMGTEFDNFSDSAHHSFTQLPATVIQNRQLLKDVMLKYGFNLFETEWWHYYWPNDRNYEVMDIDFKKLKPIKKQR